MCMREKLLVVGTSFAVFCGIVSLYLPRDLEPKPAQPDMAPVKLQSCTTGSDCPAPQACVDKVCVLPANHPTRVPQGSSEAYARWSDSALSQ